MSAIPNNYYFKEIEPIPLDQDPFPRLKKTFTAFVVVSGITVFTGGLGFALSLADIGFSLTTGTTVGIIVGVVGSIAICFFFKYETPLDRYQIKTIQQLEPVQVHPKAIEGIKYLKQMFHQGLKCRHPFEVHDLYGHLAYITENIPSVRPDVYKVWKIFLERLAGVKVDVQRKREIVLDPELELKRLDKISIPLQTYVLNKNSRHVLEELKEIENLEKASFLDNGYFPKESIHEILMQDSSNQCAIVKRTDLNTIVGFTWSRKNPEGIIYIMQVARDPKVAHAKIGEKVLCELIYQLPQKNPVHLHVRVENYSAFTVYQRLGFKQIKEEKNYYGYNEHAFLMQLDWAVFEKNYSSKWRRLSRYVLSFLHR